MIFNMDGGGEYVPPTPPTPEPETLTVNVSMDIGYHYYLYNITTGDSYFLGDSSGETLTGTIQATVGDTIGVGMSTDNLDYSAVWDGTNPLNISI